MQDYWIILGLVALLTAVIILLDWWMHHDCTPELPPSPLREMEWNDE